MTNDREVRIPSLDIVTSQAPTPQYALCIALEKAGVKLQPSLDLWTMPRPLGNSKLFVDLETDEIVCRQDLTHDK